MLSSIRKDVLSHLKGDHRKRFEAILKPDRSALPAPDPTRKLVKKWALSDFDGKLDAGGDPKRGRDIYSKALCIRCHRLGTSGIPVGPDLTGAASRFSRRDILQAILDPSQTVAMNYRSDMIRLKDGRTLTGQIVPQLDYRSPELLIATDVFNLENTVRVRKADVLQHRKSTSSLMPSGLLDTFTAVEILDLLSWIETGGSRDR